MLSREWVIDPLASQSVMSGLYGFAAALQLCTRRVVAYGFSTRSSAPPEAVANLPHWAGGKKRKHGPQLSVAAVEEMLTPPFQYHYYDACNKSSADEVYATGYRLSEENKYLMRHAHKLSFHSISPRAAAERPALPPPPPCRRMSDADMRKHKALQLGNMWHSLHASNAASWARHERLNCAPHPIPIVGILVMNAAVDGAQDETEMHRRLAPCFAACAANKYCRAITVAMRRPAKTWASQKVRTCYLRGPVDLPRCEQSDRFDTWAAAGA